MVYLFLRGSSLWRVFREFFVGFGGLFYSL
jgi:hypothetical protein